MRIHAFLGMGLLGSNFVKAMRRRNLAVQVWNRTAEKASALETFGAVAFADAADAVRNADIVHVALKDDAAVDEVLANASKGLNAGAIIIDHTTTSKEGAIRRTAYWKERGFIYQHAPVFMGPSNALEGSGYMLLSGDEGVFRQLEDHLSAMTGKLIYLGPETGKAAAVKLAGNAFLVCFTFSLREALLVGDALGLSASDLSALLQSWSPAAQTDTRLKKLAATDHSDPSWELDMARKDTQLFLDAAQRTGLDLTLLPSIAGVMDSWIEKGFGSHDWTVVGKR